MSLPDEQGINLDSTARTLFDAREEFSRVATSLRRALQYFYDARGVELSAEDYNLTDLMKEVNMIFRVRQ